MKAELATLQYDSSRGGLRMDLLIFVHSHTETDIRSRVPVCLVKHADLPYFFVLTANTKKSLYASRYSPAYILSKFHESFTLLGRG